jgi:hypothetical protein
MQHLEKIPVALFEQQLLLLHPVIFPVVKRNFSLCRKRNFSLCGDRPR